MTNFFKSKIFNLLVYSFCAGRAKVNSWWKRRRGVRELCLFRILLGTLNVDTRGVIPDLSSMRHDEVLTSWCVLISLFGTVSCVVGGWGRE